VIYIILEFEFGDGLSTTQSDNIQIYIVYFRFFRILVLLRAIKIFQKLEYMNFIFQVLKNSMDSFLSVSALFFLFICFTALIGRSLYKDVDKITYGDNPHFSTFSESFMTILTIITLDSWSDFFQLGSESFSSLISISTFLILTVCIGNYFSFHNFDWTNNRKFHLPQFFPDSGPRFLRNRKKTA